MMYHSVNMGDCSNPFTRSEGTTYRHSVSYIQQMHSIKLMDNNLLHRLHMAKIMVLDIGSNLFVWSQLMKTYRASILC